MLARPRKTTLVLEAQSWNLGNTVVLWHGSALSSSFFGQTELSKASLPTERSTDATNTY